VRTLDAPDAWPPTPRRGAGRQRQLTTRSKWTVGDDRGVHRTREPLVHKSVSTAGGLHDARLRLLALGYLADPALRASAMAVLPLLDARAARGVLP